MKQYSTAQMDDYYWALAHGVVRPSGIMNYIQHLIIAGRCGRGARVLDVCCGRGLLLPLLGVYAPQIGCYVGIDVSWPNLTEVSALLRRSVQGTLPFRWALVQADVTSLSSVLVWPFDVIVYTSSLEHMSHEDGQKSLVEMRELLADGGLLYLSTPIAEPDQDGVRYHVHVYEWSMAELAMGLGEAGFEIVETTGLLPSGVDLMDEAVARKYGPGAVSWMRDMRERVPSAFFAAVAASCLEDAATEALFVCRVRR